MQASRVFYVLAVALCAASGFSGTARATDIESLQQQLETMQKEMDRVRAEIERLKRAKTDPAEEPQDEIKVSTKGGIKVETADGAFKAELGGRLTIDSAWHWEDKSRLGDGTQFRAARLGVRGTLFHDWDYRGEYDFADDEVSVKTTYVRYTGFDPLTFRIGHFRVPYGLEAHTSSRFITFMEKTIANELLAGRRIGAGANAHGENWSAEAGIFGSDFDEDPDDEGDEAVEAAGRLTFAPVAEDTVAVHLGVSGGYTDPNDDLFSFDPDPESDLTPSFVDTGDLMHVDHALTAGAEFAAVLGPASVQGEYMRKRLVRGMGLPDLDFSGWYALASFFLTGESRNYDPSDGDFGRVTPKATVDDGGIGAWEIALRYSMLDVTDGDVSGGVERNLTVGLNWYLNPYVRFMVNYVRVDNDSTATGNAANLHVGELSAGDDDPQIIQLRVQIDY